MFPIQRRSRRGCCDCFWCCPPSCPYHHRDSDELDLGGYRARGGQGVGVGAQHILGGEPQESGFVVDQARHLDRDVPTLDSGVDLRTGDAAVAVVASEFGDVDDRGPFDSGLNERPL
ncbi:MAG: hypothetical protein MZV65_28685 [Chromatiales bacterium]|nr:hypothetical protein [Chromatiales bacterium]